jgi:hypothetical protein
MDETELSFGDLRAATERALEDPTRVDAVVWCILRAGGDPETMREYAVQKLRGVGVGSVSLADVIAFTLDGEPWLREALEAHQAGHIEKSELPRRLLHTDHVDAWCAGFAWLCARRRCHIEWPGPTVRHWIAVVEPQQGYWCGLGLNEGMEVRFYQGHEDKDQPVDTDYVIRHCQIPDGDPWDPSHLPGWPAHLNGEDPRLIDDDYYDFEDEEDYDA